MKYWDIFTNNFYMHFYFFSIYSFIAWCMETTYATIKNHKFVNRGFLSGPFCPMYGFGALILVRVLTPLVHYNLFLFFIAATLLTSIIEYITGYILEKLFNSTWWDYSEDPFNINGRICLLFSLLWGVLSILFIKIIHPFFSNFSSIVYNYYGRLFLNILFLYFILDFTATLVSLSKLNFLLGQLNVIYTQAKSTLENFKDTASEKTEYIDIVLNELKQRYEFIYSKIQKNYSRLLTAFPEFTSKKLDSRIADLKAKVHSVLKH